jgi:hypothetical protein
MATAPGERAAALLGGAQAPDRGAQIARGGAVRGRHRGGILPDRQPRSSDPASVRARALIAAGLAVAYNDALDRCTQSGGENIEEVMGCL